MSKCSTGEQHTVTVCKDGKVYCFGSNSYYQLGFEQNKWKDRPVITCFVKPTQNLNLPKIKAVSCGRYFTVCVDYEGVLWSFGTNDFGQLGVNTNVQIPGEITDIPPVLSVSCGAYHTLILTKEETLWSCGDNKYGQLCHGNQLRSITPQQTTFSAISKICAGGYHSLFQNNEGEIFGCGSNKYGQLGLGWKCEWQLEPCIILNQPDGIFQFCCGYYHSIFLDNRGNVFSVGKNLYGCLGLGNNMDQSELNQIVDIPPIKTISCCSDSSFLLDFEGNVWSFGKNEGGQLGHGDDENRSLPTKISTVKDIEQISFGIASNHLLFLSYYNEIFVTGNNYSGQLGNGEDKSISTIPEKCDIDFTIWENLPCSRAKSARK